MPRFGDFSSLCRNVPSYPWCNLFYRQLLDLSNSTTPSPSPGSPSGFLQPPSLPPTTAPVGINPLCGIPRAGQQNGSLGNIANIVLCALSFFLTIFLIWRVSMRRAAVGRAEFRLFLGFYAVTLPLQLLTTGSLLQQGGTPLVVLTAIHAGFVVATFWALLGNGIVATQVVEDGTWSSLVPFLTLSTLLLAATTYISLDTALHFTNAFAPTQGKELDLQGIALFVLTSLWPGVASLIYLILMTYIILGILKELKPMWYYILSAALFVLSQLAMFLLGRVVCQGSNKKIDSSFIATLLETAAVFVLYLGWKSITEESWDEDAYYPS